MRFIVGALALLVICVTFGSPALLLMGRSPLSATNRQIVKTTAKDAPAPASNASGETAVTIRPKGRSS